MEDIEHLGIAVEDIEEAVPAYERLLNTSCYKREVVDDQKVETAFFKTGSSKVELLAAMREDSVIGKFIRKEGEGIHHVAFKVEDIVAEMERLKKEGFRVLSEQPRRGADNKLVAFVHPKDSHGTLIELCQETE